MILLCWLCSAVCEELFHPWFCGAVCPAPGRRGRHHPAPGRYKEGGHPGEAAATTNYIADTFDDDWMRNYRLLHNSFQVLKLCGIQYMTCIVNVKPHIGFIVRDLFLCGHNYSLYLDCHILFPPELRTHTRIGHLPISVCTGCDSMV